jgi:hypothetical protein
MKKALIIALALVLTGGAAYANFCARDYVPAATLLVPYAVVDMTPAGVPDPTGYTTLLVVTNVSSTMQLIHVTVYNAASEGVVDFNEVLTGYDVWSINFRDLLEGRFDRFDTGAKLYGELGSPYGPTTNSGSFSDPLYGMYVEDTDDGGYTQADGGNPNGDLSGFADTIVNGLADPLMPYPDQLDCVSNDFSSPPWLENLSDAPIFFYVTVDVVNACNGLFPDVDSEYWTGSYPSQNNVIYGDVIYLNQTANKSESVPAVSIEADLDWGGWGFYSRYSNAASEQDYHEPLGNAFGFNYFNADGVTTDLMVWKDHEELGDYIDACRPYIYYAFDEDEHGKARTVKTCPSGLCFANPEPNVIPFETQRVPLNLANWNGLMSGNGWMMLVFDPAIPMERSTSVRQAWTAVSYYYGTYSTAIEGALLANTNCFGSSDYLPNLNAYEGVRDMWLRGWGSTF